MPGLFADISKAGVEAEPRLLEVVGRRETGRADDARQTHTHSRVVERSAHSNITTAVVRNENGAIPCEECKRGAQLPSLGREPVGG